MSDPLFDALLASDPYTATALPAPLQPSRATTPIGTHGGTSTIPFLPPVSNSQTKNIEAERRVDEAEALFDPLQGEQHKHCIHELIEYRNSISYCTGIGVLRVLRGTERTTHLSCQWSYDTYQIMIHLEDVRPLYAKAVPPRAET